MGEAFGEICLVLIVPTSLVVRPAKHIPPRQRRLNSFVYSSVIRMSECPAETLSHECRDVILTDATVSLSS